MLALSVPAVGHGSPGGPALLACRFVLSRDVGRWRYVVLLYGSLSCTTIESLQDQREVFALKPLRYHAKPHDVRRGVAPNLTLLGYAASAGAVVATYTALADADCDNGTALQHAA